MIITRGYSRMILEAYKSLVEVLYTVTKNNIGVLLLNKCKTVEHWAQESSQGELRGKFV